MLADIIPGSRVRDAALVIGAAALTGVAAQIAIPLPFTPVPISLQTFTVLLSGAALGPIRGGLAMALYLVAGLAGVPWFSRAAFRLRIPLVRLHRGFLLAAILVGWLARRGLDRTIVGAVGIMVVGNLVIYAVGVPCLANSLGVDLGRALELGALPFLVGDALKIALAAGLLPAAWWLAGSRRKP